MSARNILFIDFLLAEICLSRNQPDRGAAIIETLVTKASRDHDFVPEMYVSYKNFRFTGEVGEPTGAVPMVGYGAGVYISYLLERERLNARSVRH